MLTRREDIEMRSEQLIMPILEEHGFSLVDLEFVKEAGERYLRAYIDKPGGITIDDCETVSRAFSDALDAEDYIDGAYIMEISSPGLGRPLKKEKDFARSLGEDIEIKLYAPLNGSKEYRGRLLAYTAGTVDIEDEDGNVITIERSKAALIRLAFDF